VDGEGVAALGRFASERDGLDSRRRELLAELDGISSHVGAAVFDAELRSALDEGSDAQMLAESARDLEAAAGAAQGRLEEARQRVGEVRSRLAAYDGASRAAELQTEVESVRAHLRAAVERYAVVTLAHTLLAREMERFQRENQPQVVDRTAELFSAMTGGRYGHLRLAAEAGGEVLTVPTGSPSGTTGLGWSQLSTGTGQQLYLALRLAYLDLQADAGEPLPLVMDDVLVNFDDERVRATLAALAELSERRQILFLTCHQHIVDIARDVLPAVAVTAIAEQPT
jgi:uncharacterized protein YhaN